MPYSVSPFRRDQRVGPKPTMYWVHLDPEQLGGDEVARARAGDGDQQADARRRRCRARYMQSGHRPLPRLARQSRARARAQVSASRTSATVEVPGPARSCSSTTRATVSTIPVNGSRAGQERLDALLVGRVEHRRDGRRRRARPRASADGRERLVVQREELPGAGRRPVEGGRGARHAVGPAEAERDRQPHVGRRAPARAWSRRRTRPSSGRPTAGGPRPRSGRTGVRTAGAPR